VIGFVNPWHLIVLIVAFGLYFVPTWVALARHRKANPSLAVVLNVLLGWSVIGWIVALVVAFRKPPHSRNEGARG